MKRNMLPTFIHFSLMFSFAVNAWAQSTAPALFVVNGGITTDVTSFTIGEDGELEFVGIYPAAAGPRGCALSPNGKYLAVTHTAFHDVLIYEVNSDASLHLVFSEFLGSDIDNDVEWLNNEQLAFVTFGLTDSLILTYEFDPVQATMTLIDTVETAGTSAFLETTRDGSLLFTPTSSPRSILSHSVGEAGDLDLVEAELTGPQAFSLTASPDGNFLYSVPGTTAQQILVHAIEPNGELTALESVPTPAGAPSFVAMNEDGTILVLTLFTVNEAHTYFRDPATGQLTLTGHSFELGENGTNLLDPQMLGDLLFMTDQYPSDNGLRGVLTFRIGADGSFTQIGETVDTMGTGPRCQEVWPGILLGDVNGDGKITLLDVQPFVMALTAGTFVAAADINQDGAVNLLDVQPFVNLLSQ